MAAHMPKTQFASRVDVEASGKQAGVLPVCGSVHRLPYAGIIRFITIGHVRRGDVLAKIATDMDA